MIAYNTLEKRGDYMESIEIKRINDEIYLTLNDIIELLFQQNPFAHLHLPFSSALMKYNEH